MAALGVVADGVAGPHPDPLRDRPVLLQLLGQLDLDAESLVGRLKEMTETIRKNEIWLNTSIPLWLKKINRHLN